MNSSDPKTPILVIEDNAIHRKQISEYFGQAHLKGKYEVTPIDKLDDPKIFFNYKAEYPNNQLIIIDYYFDNLPEEDQDEKTGVWVIEKYLFPVDRTTFFIVFSMDKDVEELMYNNPIKPHWEFVHKELDNDKIKGSSLKDLLTSVDRFHKYTSPVLKIPNYSKDVRRLNQKFEDLKKFRNGLLTNSQIDLVNDSILESEKILSQSIYEVMNYKNAGLLSQKIAIGIYGSCGRLELRAKYDKHGKENENFSDIEFSVFYQSGTNDAETKKIQQLSIIFWNRFARYLSENLGYPVQGFDAEKYLEVEQLKDFNSLPDRYIQIIPINVLITQKGGNSGTENIEKARLIHRYLQIFSELKIVYNPLLIEDTKREIIKGYYDGATPDYFELISFFEDPMKQFYLSAKPSEIKTPDDYKKFCFRILNLIATRIFIISYLGFQKDKHDKKDLEQYFFKKLTDPGLLKIIDFLLLCNENQSEFEKQYTKEITDIYKKLIQKLIMFVEQYYKHLMQLRKTIKDGKYIFHLKPSILKCVSLSIEIFDLIRDLHETTRFMNVNENPWLVNTDDLTTLKNAVSK